MYLTLDTENTTFQVGNPFSKSNRCVVICYKKNDGTSIALKWAYDEPVTKDKIDLISDLVRNCECLIAFNAKYDLHWLQNYGIELPKKVWCCQVAQFIIRHQQEKYPSLNSSCEYWGLGQKINVIARDYWDKGINTDQIPWESLSEYARQDVDLTYSLFLKQKEHLRQNPKLERLVDLANQDLLVLQEMEWNGLVFDTDLANQKAIELIGKIDDLNHQLVSIFGDYPINFDSSDHKSCLLYGGTIQFKYAEPYQHTYKSGQKVGLTETRYKHSTKDVIFPQLIKPLKGSELAKNGYYSTDEGTLLKLKQTKCPAKVRSIIDLILQRSEYEKLRSTYYVGWPKKIEEMDWPENKVHANLNQCVTITGRLSSSSPNQQNIPSEVYHCLKTRF